MSKVGIKQNVDLGIKKNVKKKIEKSSGEIFWQNLVSVWFNVYAELMPEVEGEKAKPSFVGAETQHMKSIIKELRQRAESKNIIWTKEIACERFRNFLLKAFEDKFISQNFMLRIISNNRTKIFNNQITPKNGTTYSDSNQQRKASSSDARVNAIASWGKRFSSNDKRKED